MTAWEYYAARTRAPHSQPRPRDDRPRAQLRRGASPDVKTIGGQTPGMLAQRWGERTFGLMLAAIEQGGGPAAFFQAVDKATGGIDEDGDGVPDNDEDGGESDRAAPVGRLEPPLIFHAHARERSFVSPIPLPTGTRTRDDGGSAFTTITHMLPHTSQCLMVYLVPTRAGKSGTATARRHGGPRGRS